MMELTTLNITLATLESMMLLRSHALSEFEVILGTSIAFAKVILIKISHLFVIIISYSKSIIF
jgi:hypothetical protein